MALAWDGNRVRGDEIEGEQAHVCGYVSVCTCWWIFVHVHVCGYLCVCMFVDMSMCVRVYGYACV